MIPDASVLGPRGLVFLNGRSNQTKQMLMQAIEFATPTVIINHTGGQASMIAQIVKALALVIRDDIAMLGRLVDEKTKTKPRKNIPVEERIGLIKPTALLNFALKNSCGDPN